MFLGTNCRYYNRIVTPPWQKLISFKSMFFFVDLSMVQEKHH